MTENITAVEFSPLGKKSEYITQYAPTLLFPIPRQIKRAEIQVPQKLPFFGWDIWNAYELSWLNEKGKPQVAIAHFFVDCTSENIIESKSFKLYLNSFNNTKISSISELKNILQNDLQKAVKGTIRVEINNLSTYNSLQIDFPQGICLDELDINCDEYTVNSAYLISDKNKLTIQETVYSNLLKSNCLVTSQPDWGSVEISYLGSPIDHENLLRYLVSFRNHDEFHEQCVERIFMDISNKCHPLELTVKAWYTRRGGLDINPIRSSAQVTAKNLRMARQ